MERGLLLKSPGVLVRKICLFGKTPYLEFGESNLGLGSTRRLSIIDVFGVDLELV